MKRLQDSITLSVGLIAFIPRANQRKGNHIPSCQLQGPLTEKINVSEEQLTWIRSGGYYANKASQREKDKQKLTLLCGIKRNPVREYELATFRPESWHRSEFSKCGDQEK